MSSKKVRVSTYNTHTHTHTHTHNLSIRNNFIDALRIISCFAVYIIHYIAVYKTTFGVENPYLDIIKTYCNFAVPCFFMISGYLHSFKRCDYRSILRKTLYYYIITVMVNIMCMYCNSIFRNEQINFSAVIISSIFLHTVTHLWFMPVLLGIYLLIPVISNIDKKTYIYIYVIILFFGYIKSKLKLEFNINIMLYNIYLLYFMTGGIIKVLDDKLKRLIVMLLIIFFAFNSIFYRLNFMYSYEDVGVFILSTLVFLIFSLTLNSSRLFLFELLSQGTFYTYLLHPFVIHFMFTKLHIRLNNYMFFVVLFITFFALLLVVSLFKGIIKTYIIGWIER